MQSVWFYQVEYKIAVNPNTQISLGEKTKLHFWVQSNRNWDMVSITSHLSAEDGNCFLLIFLGCIAGIVASHLCLNQYCRKRGNDLAHHKKSCVVIKQKSLFLNLIESTFLKLNSTSSFCIDNASKSLK